jgi:hypothetical protein
MLVIFPIYNRVRLLPFFLRYYSSLGATRFVCALYNGERNPLYEQILPFESRYNLSIEESTRDRHLPQYSAVAEGHGLNRIREAFSKNESWYCIADLDEFYFFGGRNLSDLVYELERKGYDAAHGIFFDRIAADGTFPEIGNSLDDTFPLACDLTHCAGLCNRKITIARSALDITPGHHDARGKILFHAAEVHHFKWHKGVRENVTLALKHLTQQGFRTPVKQMPHLLKLIDKQIDIQNPKLRTRIASKLGI